MSANSQYATLYKPITGGLGRTFTNATVLSATLPVGTANTDCASLTLQEGLYIFDFEMGGTANNTSTMASVQTYLGSAPAGASIITEATFILEPITLTTNRLTKYKISQVVTVTSPNTVIYGGITATIGVVAFTVSAVLIKATRLSA